MTPNEVTTWGEQARRTRRNVSSETLKSWDSHANRNMVLGIKRKTDWEKVLNAVDMADAEAGRARAQGMDPTKQELYAKALRKNSYSFKRLSRRTMVELVKRNDPEALATWNKMWDEMKEGRLHPRELKAFYDNLVATKPTN